MPIIVLSLGFEVATEDWAPCKLKFQSAEVSRPILSATKLIESGHEKGASSSFKLRLLDLHVSRLEEQQVDVHERMLRTWDIMRPWSTKTTIHFPRPSSFPVVQARMVVHGHTGM